MAEKFNYSESNFKKNLCLLFRYGNIILLLILIKTRNLYHKMNDSFEGYLIEFEYNAFWLILEYLDIYF